MKAIVLYVLLGVLFEGAVNAFNPGAAASLDVNVVDQAKDVYWNYVM